MPTPEGGTHEAGPAHRAAPRPEGLCRADRPDKRAGADHRRRRDGRPARPCSRCSSASPSSRARPRRSCPRRRPRASSRTPCATPFDHWLTASAAQAERAARLGRSSAPRSGCAAAQEKEVARKTGDAQAAPARQAGRLLAAGAAGLRALHRRGRLGRRLGQAGARPRAPRRSCRCAARSSTSPAPTRDKLAANQELSDLVLALGCGTGSQLPRRGPALREGRHHDRRRRRRRPHRLAADHLLLPRRCRS